MGTDFTSHTWLHAENPNEHEVSVLCDQYHLSNKLVHDALDRDEISRVEPTDDYMCIITRFAFQTDRGDTQTAPILFALNDTKLITVSREKLPNISHKLIDSSEKDPSLIMLKIMLSIDAQYDKFINNITKEIRKLQNRLGKRDVGTKDFIEFVRIEDDLNDFLSALHPTNSTLSHLLSSESKNRLIKHRDLVNTIILNNEQSIQTCEANLKLLASIRRTFSLISQHHLDRTIKILTLASVFISIPTMFFSMYGMNVPLPEQHRKEAFLFVLFLCVVTTWSAYFIGRKKRIF